MATKKKLKINTGIKEVVKRNLARVPFDAVRIQNVISRAFNDTKENINDEKAVEKVLSFTLTKLKVANKASGEKNWTPSVELIQDFVENAFVEGNYPATAKAFILFRQKRSEQREKMGIINPKIRELAQKSKAYFRNDMGEFIFYRTYSRWIEEEGRRETWIETVRRYIGFMRENLGEKLSEKEYTEIEEYILNQWSMPSMRLMQFSGPAARRTNVCAYNCSFIAPSKISDFAEVMYISMCGTGVGFSVESQNVERLPQVEFQTGETLKTFTVPDSKEGWCDSLNMGLRAWFSGQDIQFNYTELRPAGARLKVMGGKSSGPEPLRRLHAFAREKILSRQGRRLRPIDVHDIICKIGEVVVSGGVRRSALISLSDLDDVAMREAKMGQFWLNEPQRAIANNSAVYDTKPPQTEFLQEWVSLMKSGSGERGIFNRGSLADTLPKRRIDISEKFMREFGTNPCGEIILRSKQFCNLSEVIARSEDTEETLLNKVRIATILGTYQASLTKFPYLSKEWTANCRNEALLGVSVTGQWDCPAVRNAETLQKMKTEAIKINKKYAQKFGINPSTCITCVKPSGTVSQTFDTSSGMHARYAPYYIKRVRISSTDALFHMLKDQGVPYHPEVGQSAETANTFVLEFPIAAPKGSTFIYELSAIDQLEHWKLVKVNFTEHNPSVTVSVGEDEWIAVANWIYENWDIVGGLSFLPRSNHVYQLAPFEEITKEQYMTMKENFATMDFSKIPLYETVDGTDVKKELACVSGVCDIDDAVAVEANNLNND